MNKQVKKPIKTTFVRNTDQQIPKVTIKNPQSTCTTRRTTTKPPSQSTKANENRQVKFDEPQPNSSKTIIKKINIVKNVKTSEIKQPKITKKVNFPPDRPIYKDLMPLCVKKEPTRVTTSRDPLPPKDIEPNLSDFFQPEMSPEYIFKIESKPSIVHNLRHVKFDGYKLTKHVDMWENVETLKSLNNGVSKANL